MTFAGSRRIGTARSSFRGYATADSRSRWTVTGPRGWRSRWTPRLRPRLAVTPLGTAVPSSTTCGTCRRGGSGAATVASVRERFGVDCRQVPFCFDSERFTPAPATRRRGLLTVSHLTPHKNQAAVIRAAARLEPKTTVRIIGRGPERASLERLAATLGVACSIESDLTETDMVTAYRTAEVVVCPSTFEGFGLTPMEAIATATPVVASDIPPHREFLGASRAGPPPAPDVLSGVTIDAAAERFSAGLMPYLR